MDSWDMGVNCMKWDSQIGCHIWVHAGLIFAAVQRLLINVDLSFNVRLINSILDYINCSVYVNDHAISTGSCGFKMKCMRVQLAGPVLLIALAPGFCGGRTPALVCHTYTSPVSNQEHQSLIGIPNKIFGVISYRWKCFFLLKLFLNSSHMKWLSIGTVLLPVLFLFFVCFVFFLHQGTTSMWACFLLCSHAIQNHF